jgi:FkbM family methyltransferase
MGGDPIHRAAFSALEGGLAALTSLRRIVASSGNLPTVAVLSGVSLYAWLLSKRGQGITEVVPVSRSTGESRSLRSRLATSGFAHRSMRFRMRDGSRITCRIVDSGGPLSVYADADYDVPGVDWPAVGRIVDIGAHVGSFTIWAATRAPQARCLAVEPNPETYKRLVANIRDNGLQDRVTTVNAAVGVESGTGRLELVEHSLGTRLARTGEGEVAVRVESLSSLLAAAGMTDVDVLKVDCEGMEYDLFGAMTAERFQSIGVIACEYHPELGHAVAELDALLHGAGFEVRRPDASLGVLWATRPVS